MLSEPDVISTTCFIFAKMKSSLLHLSGILMRLEPTPLELSHGTPTKDASSPAELDSVKKKSGASVSLVDEICTNLGDQSLKSKMRLFVIILAESRSTCTATPSISDGSLPQDVTFAND